MMPNATEKLVEFFLNTDYGNIPEPVVRIAKYAIMDVLGQACAAVTTGAGRMLLHCIPDTREAPCSVIGTGRRASLMEACWLNASLAQVLDYDDTYEIASLGVSHPGPAVVPAALAVCESEHCGGKELVRAVVLGYEAACRTADAIEPREYEFWGFANTQIMGAVTAASILLGLDSGRFVNAIGIAASSSPVPNTHLMWSLTKRPMSWVKDAVGCAASSGVISALMAGQGFCGTRNGLDEVDGYYLLCGSRSYNEYKLTEALGKRYRLSDLSFKPYPTCRFMQSTLDSVSLIVQEHDLDEKDIESVEVFVTPFLAEAFSVYEPASMIDAQFSMPYAIAGIIRRIVPSPAWYNEERMSDPVTRAAMKKVKLVPDEKIERLRAERSILSPKVRIRTKGGGVYERQEYCAKGHPDKPFSREDFTTKFTRCLESAGRGLYADRAIETIEHLEQCEDIGGLLALFAPQHTSGGEQI
jgi:2-methylcitrate dehydratase PrpD